MFLKCSKMFYQSYILPLIDNGSIFWVSTSKLNIERINKLLKRAAQRILKDNYATPSVEMFQRLRWMPVFQRINYNKIVSEYDQEIPQSQTADNPTASRGRATQPLRDIGKTNQAK